MEIIPSFYKVEDVGADVPSGLYGNLQLRIGEVQKIVYPSDERSVSKKIPEYDVLVTYSEGGTYTRMMYRSCTISNLFGGLADKFSFTLRTEHTEQDKTKDFGLKAGLGSKVLLLCVDGNRNNAIIMGGIRDAQDVSDKQVKEKGHNLHFNFNGIDFVVNKDGELVLQYQGATDADSKMNKDVDKNAVGTTLTIQKNGNFVVNTKDKKQSVTINHEKKTIDIIADSAYTVKAKDVKVDASGSVAITDKDGTSIKGKGVKVGGATDAWMKGTSYRKAQSQMHSKIIAGLSQAAIALPFFQMGAVASGLMQVVSAISTFEAQSSKYLSKKNKTD